VQGSAARVVWVGSGSADGGRLLFTHSRGSHALTGRMLGGG